MKFLNEASSSLSSDHRMSSGFYTHRKKNLCSELYRIHLLPANIRNALRRYIESVIEEKLKIIFNIKHQNLNNKTNDVTRNHVSTPDCPVTVYPTVINKTDTDFSNEKTVCVK